MTTTRQDIEDFINSLPEERREHMHRFQWRIDQELNKCKDPAQRYNKMVEMFWEGFGKFNQVLQTTCGKAVGQTPVEAPPKAKVVPFPKR